MLPASADRALPIILDAFFLDLEETDCFDVDVGCVGVAFSGIEYRSMKTMVSDLIAIGRFVSKVVYGDVVTAQPTEAWPKIVEDSTDLSWKVEASFGGR